MLTDYHCHVLPGMDDGAKDVETSIQMLDLLKKQGVARVVATPHFYAHRETSVDEFLRKREEAKQKIIDLRIDTPELLLGAEVAIEQGLSSIQGIEKLAMEGSNRILLEFPYSGFAYWMQEEVYNISYTYKLQPIFAHIHRYVDVFSKKEMDLILSTENATFQINYEIFENSKEKKFLKSLLKKDLEIVYGSDAHNMTSRRPNTRPNTRLVK